MSSGAPSVTFQTLTGETLWFEPMTSAEMVTEGGGIQRRFGVQSADGARRVCTVEVTPDLERRVFVETGQELAADGPVWDTVCRLALQRELRRTGATHLRMDAYERSVTGDGQYHGLRDEAARRRAMSGPIRSA